MAYKEHGMWEVLDVLRRVHRGESRRQVALATGRSRRTVDRYLHVAAELGWVATLHEPDEELAAAVIAQLRPGPKEPVVNYAEAVLTPWTEQIKAWLTPHDGQRRGLKLSKIHTLLTRQNVKVSYWALRRFAKAYCDFGKGSGCVRMADVAPGEVAEVDFGRLGYIQDAGLARRVVLYALVVTLVHSRHQYVHLTTTQKLKDVIAGLEDAWEFFGGTPARLIVDNMKAAVLKADRYEPEFQRTFNEYADYRGLVIDAAVANMPTGKPHVERQVPYVRENFFKGETFIDLDHAQREARRWCVVTAGARIHGTTRKQPLVEFERVEKAALNPLVAPRFDTPTWAEPKVHPDQHVRFKLALYSVPYQHLGVATKGKKVTVRGDSSLVRIYLRGVLIKTHQRQEPGGRSTDPTDYPAEKTPYAMRDVNFIVAKAKEHGPNIGLFCERLLSGHVPWSHLRQAQKLLRLVDKFGDECVDNACRRALSFDLVSVRRIERIVLNAIENQALDRHHDKEIAQVIQLPLRFLRPADSLNHKSSTEN